jgi:hypothetical protein
MLKRSGRRAANSIKARVAITWMGPAVEALTDPPLNRLPPTAATGSCSSSNPTTRAVWDRAAASGNHPPNSAMSAHRATNSQSTSVTGPVPISVT